jgi:hypothetical protein
MGSNAYLSLVLPVQARSLDTQFAVMVVQRRCDWRAPRNNAAGGCTLITYIKYNDNLYQASINMGTDPASLADNTVVCGRWIVFLFLVWIVHCTVADLVTLAVVPTIK